MATNSVPSTRAGAESNATAATGQTTRYGIYKGIVTKVLKNTRMGELEVFIPEFDNGSGNDFKKFKVTYASPFFGRTYLTDSGLLPTDKAEFSGQSYGMWFVPPDIGNEVLCCFLNGSPDDGYWFACPVNTPSHHMVPGIARHIAGQDYASALPEDNSLSQYQFRNGIYPVGEANYSDGYSKQELVNIYRYIHEAQMVTYVRQGLDRDPIRGAISSSSMRESPSNVYGVSTPGRNPSPGGQISENDPERDEQKVVFRMGGHQFVMDDGSKDAPNDPDGTDQLIRLRTAGGHQILMNDTEEILYIASGTGNQWMEFSNNGSMNVYAAGGFNLRSDGSINMHSEKGAITMNAKTIKLNADYSVSLSSLGSVTMSSLVYASVKTDGILTLSSLGKASLVTGGALTVGAVGVTNISGSLTNFTGIPITGYDLPSPVPPTIPNFLQDTDFQNNAWTVIPSALASACSVVPAHEPWTKDGEPASRPDPEFGGLQNIAIGIAIGAGIGAVSPTIDSAVSAGFDYVKSSVSSIFK